MSNDETFNNSIEKAAFFAQGGQTHIGTQNIVSQESTANSKPTRIPNNIFKSQTIKFVGREKYLNDIHEKLINSCNPVAVFGTGGIGKTELAIQYALKYRESYEGGICCFNARGEDLATSILAFARSHFNIHPPTDLDIKNKLGFYWSRWPKGKVLIIYDDVDNFDKIKEYLPPANDFKLLITTRSNFGTSGIQFVEMTVFDEAVALDVLKSSLPENDKRIEEEIDCAQELCQWLDYLPLTLNLVGIHLAQKQDLSVSTMLERLNKENLGQKAIDRINGVIELSWEELSDEAKELSYFLSLFALAPIPWETVEELFGKEPDKVEELRDEELLKFSLLQRKEKGLYQFHNIIREFIKNKRDELDSADDLKMSFCHKIMNYMISFGVDILYEEKILELLENRGLTYLLNFLQVEEIAKNFTDLMRYDQLLQSHGMLVFVYTVIGNYVEAIKWGEICKSEIEDFNERGDTDYSFEYDINFGTIRYHVAKAYLLQGNFTKAKEYLEEILECTEDDTRDIFRYLSSMVLSDLGKLLASKGEFEQAENYCRKALEIKEKLVEKKDINITPFLTLDLVPNLNALANVCRIRGKYKEAEELYKKLFQFFDNCEGEELQKYLLLNIEMIIDILINNSTLYLEQGLTEAAKEFCEEAKNRVMFFGDQHPIYATYLSNLAQVYIAQGRHKEAEEICQEVITINEENGNTQYPTHAINLRNLGSIYTVQGRYDDAKKLYKQALDIQKQIYGEEHRDVAASLVHLAVHHIEQTDYDTDYDIAEFLLGKAQKIYKSVLGISHPKYADVLSVKAYFYGYQKKDKKAEDLYKEAIDIVENTLGDKHLKYIEKLKDYADFLVSQNRKEEAGEFYQKSLDIVEELFGENNPIVCEYMLMIAETQRSLGDEKKAESMYAKAIGIYENDNSINPDFSQGLMRLIEVYELQGRYDEIGALYKRLLEVSRKLLGNEHPNVVNILNKWANNLTKQSKYEEAAKLYEESLEIIKGIFKEEKQHPSIAINMGHLAYVYESLKRYDEAIKFYEKQKEIRIYNYGNSDKKVLIINNKLNELKKKTLSNLIKKQDNSAIIEVSNSVSERPKLLQKKQPANNDKEVPNPEMSEQSEAVNSKTSEIENLPEQNTQLENEGKELQKQNAKLQSELKELREQQNRFQAQIKEYQDSNLKDQIAIHNFVEKLIQLKKEEYTKLSQPLEIVLNDLEKQQQDYKQTWDRLQTAIQQFNKYKEETDEISFNLNAHYEADCALNENPLPLDRQKVNEIIQKVRQLLADLDKELSDALIQHEQSQKKKFITF